MLSSASSYRALGDSDRPNRLIMTVGQLRYENRRGCVGGSGPVSGRSSQATGRSEMDRPETIEETGELIRAAGGAGSALVVDHEDPAAVAGLVATIERDHGGLTCW